MARGQAMSAPDDPEFDAGTMLAVKGDADAILEAIKAFPEVKAANLNSRNQIVLAGSKPAIAEAQQALAAQGFFSDPPARIGSIPYAPGSTRPETVWRGDCQSKDSQTSRSCIFQHNGTALPPSTPNRSVSF